MATTEQRSIISSNHLYDRYHVKLAFRDRLHGGIPKNKELLDGWIKASTGYEDEIQKGLVEEAKQQMLDEVSERSWNGFYREPEKGIYVETRQIKAMFKECATVLQITKKKLGSKQIFQHAFFVDAVDGGKRVYVGKQKEDGREEGPIHIMTAQGPRTALKRVDYVENVVLEFYVRVLKTAAQENRHIGEDDMRQMLALAQDNGFGADRSQGNGTFDVVAFEKLEEEAVEGSKKPGKKAAA
jgi:hypothetical protein